MSNISDAKSDPIGQIWDKLDSVHAVMLGSPDHAQHMQPMAPQTATRTARAPEESAHRSRHVPAHQVQRGMRSRAIAPR